MSMSNGWSLALVGMCGLVPLGCIDTLVPMHADELAPSVVHAPHIPGDAFVTLNGFKDMHAELCDLDGLHPNFPDGADTLTRVFCQDFAPGGVMPTPSSLDDLLKLLGLDFKDPNGGNGTGGNPGFALLGHSSALTARKVSSIAPTAFVFTPPPADGSKPKGYVFLAYDPGETFVEVASHDPTLDVVNFYLVFFDKECTNAPGGCTNKDLLTPNLTKGWSNLRQYESSTSLNNTIADCRQCHAPDDSKDQILRMQENTAPFTHWFSTETEGGRALFQDFHAAHGTTEDYGPIPAALVDKSDPAKMAQMIKQAGFADQPNAFFSKAIEEEAKAWAPQQPAVNVPTGYSVTWAAAYDKSVGGQFIAAPYHDVKITDPAKLAPMTAAYQQFLKGTLQGDLPDIRDVFLDEGLRDMGFSAKRGLDGKGLLVQLCQQCHNTLLDPMISRDKFLVDRLDQMSRDEKNLAIDRLLLPDTQALFMPPRLFRTMTDQERDLMIAELKK